MLIIGGPSGQAQTQNAYQLAIGTAGTDSFIFGTELWAASQINLLPSYNLRIETVAVQDENERLRQLRDGHIDFALVGDKVNPYIAGDVRAVMALWPNGADKLGARATQLLVHPETPYSVVYHITRMIFEHSARLRSAHATIGIGSPRSAIVGLELPMHPGALRYYEERGLGIGRHIGQTLDKPEIVRDDELESAPEPTLSEAKQLNVSCQRAVAHGSLDHGDRDERFEACDVEGLDIVDADLTKPPPGRGGPRVIIRSDEEIDWRADRPRSSQQTQTPGLQPTM